MANVHTPHHDIENKNRLRLQAVLLYCTSIMRYLSVRKLRKLRAEFIGVKSGYIAAEIFHLDKAGRIITG